MTTNPSRLSLEKLADNSVAARNFQRIEQQFVKGPAQARVYNSANISLTNNTIQALTFDSERWDTGGFHSTAANTSRLTAPTAGLYSIGASVSIAANATGTRNLRITLNGTTDLAIQGPTGVTAVNQPIIVVTEYQLAAGDYVEARAFQNSGGALNALAAGNSSPEFWIHRIGSQA